MSRLSSLDALRIAPIRQIGEQSALEQAITEEERDDILSQIGSGALSGIGYVGGLLDKFTGSRALRGLLGGQPRELLSVLPGSDTLGITDRRDVVSGGDLLTQFTGMKNDPDAWDPHDFGGFALEVLLDPTLPLTFGAGALTKAGQAVKKAGYLDTALQGAHRVEGLAGLGKRQLRNRMTVGDVKNVFADDDFLGPRVLEDLAGLDDAARIGGSVGVGLPFAAPSGTIGGAQGGLLDRIAGVKDHYGRALSETPPARYAAELFDPLVQGTRFARGQRQAREISNRTRLTESLRMQDVGRAIGDFERSGVFQGVNGGENMDKVRQWLETPEGSQSKGMLTEQLPEELQPLVPTMQGMKDNIEALKVAAQREGVEVTELQDFIDYFPRIRNRLPGEDLSRRSHKQFWDTFNPMKLARGEHMKGNFTDAINKISMDDRFSGIAHSRTDGLLTSTEKAKMWQEMREEYGLSDEMFAEGGFTKSLDEDAPLSKFLDSIAGLDPRHAKDQIPLFNRDPLRDYYNYAREMNRSIEAAKGVRRLLGDHVEFADDIPEGVANRSLSDVMKEAKMNPNREANLLGIMDAIERNPQMMERIRSVMGNDFQFDRANPDSLLNVIGRRQLTEGTSQLAIRKDVVEDSLRFMSGHMDPKNLHPVVEAYDKFTQQFKTALTAIWPSFHTRNAVSALFNNFVIGMGSGNPSKILKALNDGYGIARGRELTGLESIKGLGELASDRARTNAIVDEMYANGVLSRQQSQMGETAAGQLEDLAGRPDMIGNTDLLQETKQAGRDIFRRQSPRQMYGQLTEAASGASSLVETINRAAPYIDLRKQGYSAAEAAAKVKAAQVDYRALTNFERNYMRRALPFYTFTRRQIPFQMEALVQRPAGSLAQTIRGTARMGEDDRQFVPEHIAQTAAIPWGKASDGVSQRYITGFGLAHEDVMNLLRPRRTMLGTVSQSAAGLLGRLNPALKAPIELAANRSLFSGRELADLDSPLNRIVGNVQQMATGETPGPMPQPGLGDYILSNSPVSRLLSTIRTGTDPRKSALAKAMQLGTGMRITDVDPEKAEQIAMRQALQELIQGSAGIGKYESLYVRDPEQVSPREALMMQVYDQLKRESAQRARLREQQP